MDRLLLITTGGDMPFGITFQRLPMVIKGTNRKGRFGSAEALQPVPDRTFMFGSLLGMSSARHQDYNGHRSHYLLNDRN